MASKAAETAANIDDMSQRTGLSAQKLQEFKYAAEQSGAGIEAFESASKKFIGTLGSLKSGNKETAEAFKQLGISALDSSGNLKSTNELFPQVLSKLADMGNRTERDALLIKLFGKSALDLAPMLNSGSAGIQAMTDEAHKLGLVMSDESIAAGAEFDDMVAKTKSTLGAVTTQIGLSLIPMFQKALDWVMANMPTIQATLSTAFNTVAVAVQWVIDNSNWLIPVLAAVGAAFVFLKIVSVVNTLMGIFEAITGTATVAQTLFNAALWASPITWIIMSVVALIAIIVLLAANWDTVKEKLVSAFQAIWGVVQPILEGIKNGFKSMVNSVIGALNLLITGINLIKFDVPDWVPMLGGKEFGFNIPHIPQFAIGTRYLPKDMLVQAHEGEMIVPKSENPYANSGGHVLPASESKETNIYLIIDGREFAKATIPYMDRQQGEDIKIQARGIGAR